MTGSALVVLLQRPSIAQVENHGPENATLAPSQRDLQIILTSRHPEPSERVKRFQKLLVLRMNAYLIKDVASINELGKRQSDITFNAI